MSTETTQRYIVHLDIRSSAPDPAQAVQDALEQVMLGGVGDVAYTVEAVDSGDALGADLLPEDAAQALAEARCSARLPHVYRGEFLG